MNPGIIASIAAIGVFCLTLGLSYPLLALILDGMGLSPGMIGLNAAMTPLGIIASSPFIPPIARRFGAWFVCVFSLCLAAVLLMLMAVFRDVTIWFLLRFLLGIANTVIFVTSETWINQLAPPKIRGRIIGLYTTVAAADLQPAARPFRIDRILDAYGAHCRQCPPSDTHRVVG